MRKPVLSLFILFLSAGPGAALDAAEDELRRLEQAWHGCLREASGHQPAGQSRAGDQRNALDACREREDAYVAAAMAVQAPGGPARERARAVHERAWASSVASYVLDPITAWLGRLSR